MTINKEAIGVSLLAVSLAFLLLLVLLFSSAGFQPGQPPVVEPTAEIMPWWPVYFW